ncbi:MAG: hypothetical protein J6A80_07555 [Lachnospiraceae bacterium]|nr:hypothetical protein [Lachnospiraceae bacterium]MBO5326068.1 hypothetical protein [Lachnospiraceae bacterium]
MKNNITEFIKLGKIPNDNDMTNELFRKYDLLLQNEEPLTYDEAELVVSMFSDDCDDLNWALLHAIESVDYYDVERYKKLIAKCNNIEFKKLLEIRLNNFLCKKD